MCDLWGGPKYKEMLRSAECTYPGNAVDTRVALKIDFCIQCNKTPFGKSMKWRCRADTGIAQLTWFLSSDFYPSAVCLTIRFPSALHVKPYQKQKIILRIQFQTISLNRGCIIELVYFELPPYDGSITYHENRKKGRSMSKSATQAQKPKARRWLGNNRSNTFGLLLMAVPMMIIVTIFSYLPMGGLIVAFKI